MPARLKDTLLLIGDEDSCRADLRRVFEDTHYLLEAENIPQAMMLLEQNSASIALILMDLPAMNAETVAPLMKAAAVGTEREIPTIALLEAPISTAKEESAFLLGVTDVTFKPFSAIAIQRRVQTLLDLFLHKWSLEKMVAEQSETIRNTNQVMLDALSAIIERRSAESGNHVLRIRRFTRILLEEVARCCPEYELTQSVIDIIASASALHDIGKISVPDAILNKPGKLTAEEFDIMKNHTVAGCQMVKRLAGMGEELFLRYAYNISLYHHERWDGSGYPRGLAGDEIPICAQVVGLTDAFDALTSARIYKPAYAYQHAINMILNGECGEFSPKLLECFKRVRAQFVDLARNYADGYSPKADNIAVPLPGPVWQSSSMNSLELSQAKYRTLLRYLDCTVLELDLDHGLYHMVYNPDPEFDPIVPHASFQDISQTLSRSRIHPEDEPVLEEIRLFLQEVAAHMSLPRRTFVLRLFSPILEDYQHYELAFMRVNTGNAGQRVVTAVWRKLPTSPISAAAPAPQRNTLHNAPALYGLVSSALRCHNDLHLTIDAGAADLFSLVGYTAQELHERFQNRLMELVHPADRAALLGETKKALNTGAKAETEFRLLPKNGEALWVLAKFRPAVEERGQDCFYFAIRDNSQSRQMQQLLLSEIKRSQLLIEQSGGIVFEWDLQADTMYCSPKWVEHFGYEPVAQNYGSQMGIATHFHPDDLPQIRTTVQSLKDGGPRIAMDVRIANASGKYLWTRITAAGYRDENGHLQRIIGLLQDIDALKRATLVLKEQAERDSLTKLLNKSSAHAMINDYLIEREPETLAGLLVLDLDNFKSINDTQGHLYGDMVLTQIGAALKKLFRVHDIIGRVGGDEFVVLLKDIPSETVLRERCESLLDTMRALLARLVPSLQVSCSIGVAMVPAHGTTFNELFSHADEALYSAKSRGKNRYKIYTTQDKYIATQDIPPRTTQIDSDDPTVVTSTSFERFVFQSLYESRDLNTTINELLAIVGSHFNVSRAYIFENNEDNSACSNTFEWCNDGITPQKDNLQNVSYITDIPGWPDMYNEKNIVYCTDISQLAPQFRDILEPQGIKSMLHCAIMDQGVFRGYVGFDECSSHRLWTQNQLHQLEFLAEVFSVFLLKQRGRERQAESAGQNR